MSETCSDLVSRPQRAAPAVTESITNFIWNAVVSKCSCCVVCDKSCVLLIDNNVSRDILNHLTTKQTANKQQCAHWAQIRNEVANVLSQVVYGLYPGY